MKVLLILNHAPDYRESFLRELGSQVDLTVVAQPCDPDGLTPPDERVHYRYVEIVPFKFFGLFWQPGLRSILHERPWDVVCVSANLRHISRLFLFLTHQSHRERWVWWGHILGRSESKILSIFRKYLVSNAACCLVHGKSIAACLNEEFGVNAVSFNNTEIKENELRQGVFEEHKELRLLFVGRYQPRKQLERLVALVDRMDSVQVRLIGPGMETLSIPSDLLASGRMEIFDRTVGNELNSHFDWADLVVNPGHVGLLVMNAARHGKGIVIDSDSDHAPEFYLAKEAEQPFIPFADIHAVEQFVTEVRKNRALLQHWGAVLQKKAKQEYTIEAMVGTHVRVFESLRHGDG